jgi:hypothetical protein
MPARRNAPAKTTRAAIPLLAGRPFEVSTVTHKKEGNETDIFIFVGDICIQVLGGRKDGTMNVPDGTVHVSIDRRTWEPSFGPGSKPGEMSEALEHLSDFEVKVVRDDPWK